PVGPLVDLPPVDREAPALGLVVGPDQERRLVAGHARALLDPRDALFFDERQGALDGLADVGRLRSAVLSVSEPGAREQHRGDTSDTQLHGRSSSTCSPTYAAPPDGNRAAALAPGRARNQHPRHHNLDRRSLTSFWVPDRIFPLPSIFPFT